MENIAFLFFKSDYYIPRKYHKGSMGKTQFWNQGIVSRQYNYVNTLLVEEEFTYFVQYQDQGLQYKTSKIWGIIILKLDTYGYSIKYLLALPCQPSPPHLARQSTQEEEERQWCCYRRRAEWVPAEEEEEKKTWIYLEIFWLKKREQRLLI